MVFALTDTKIILIKDNFLKVNYRPFDYKWTYYTGKSKGFHSYPRNSYATLPKRRNLGLIVSKQFGGGSHFICFLTNLINEKSLQPFAPFYNHPLYLYPKNNEQQNLDGSSGRIPNLNPQMIKQIADGLGMTFTNEKETGKQCLFC